MKSNASPPSTFAPSSSTALSTSSSKTTGSTSASRFLAEEFPLRKSALFDRLQTFLPQISAANAQLPSISADGHPNASNSPPAMTDECGVVIERLGEDEAEESGSDSETTSDSTDEEERVEESRLECIEPKRNDQSGAPFRAQLLDGRSLRFSVDLSAIDGETVRDVRRIRVKMNDDRVVVLVDNRRPIADIHSPIRFDPNEATVEFDPPTAELVLRIPVVWI